jgi:hypothetical protein
VRAVPSWSSTTTATSGGTDRHPSFEWAAESTLIAAPAKGPQDPGDPDALGRSPLHVQVGTVEIAQDL